MRGHITSQLQYNWEKKKGKINVTKILLLLSCLPVILLYSTPPSRSLFSTTWMYLLVSPGPVSGFSYQTSLDSPHSGEQVLRKRDPRCYNEEIETLDSHSCLDHVRCTETHILYLLLLAFPCVLKCGMAISACVRRGRKAARLVGSGSGQSASFSPPLDMLITLRNG